MRILSNLLINDFEQEGEEAKQYQNINSNNDHININNSNNSNNKTEIGEIELHIDKNYSIIKE